MATALGGTALVLGLAAPAFASAHHAADGSPAQPNATPAAIPLLGLHLRGQSLGVNAAAVARHHTSSRARAIHRVAAGYRNRLTAVDHRTSRKAHRGSRSGQHHTRHEVAGMRNSLGSRLLQDVARPGSPAQLLTLLVIMCAIGTAFVVSLARRKDPKPVRVRNRSEER